MSARDSAGTRNVDPSEIDRFSALAAEWWDPQGPSRPLHEINPCRLAFIDERAPLAGRTVLDIGCGGGLLTESMARLGAIAHGIDASAAVIEAAREHAALEHVSVRYDAITAEAWAEATPARYAVITCMELLEQSAKTSADKLKFFRLAFGAAGGFAGRLHGGQQQSHKQRQCQGYFS